MSYESAGDVGGFLHWVRSGALLLMCVVATGASASTAGVQSCSATTQAGTAIPIVPVAGPNLAWTWGVGSPTPIEEMGCTAVYGNLWGVTGGSGQVSLSTTPALVTSVNLTQITPQTGIVGFPEIFYGYKPFGGYMTSQSPALVFPLTVSSLPNLWLMTKYSSAISDKSLPMNFAYDLWLTQSYEPTSTQRGDIELMVWLYHQGLMPSGTLLPQQTFTTPIWLNGTLQMATFDMYAATPNLPNHTSELVTFVLRQGSVVGGTTGGIANGSVGFNLQPMLVHMERALMAQFGLSSSKISAEYLNGLELGEEFEADQQAATFGWTLSSFCAVKPKTGTPPQQADAAGFVCP